MKKTLKILSILAFAVAIPAFILTDCFHKGYGLFMLFLFETLGLVFDQLGRIYYPSEQITPTKSYHINKWLNLFTLILFVQSPVALIYGNRALMNLGTWLMIGFICFGIILNQIARIKFPYQNNKKDKG